MRSLLSVILICLVFVLLIRTGSAQAVLKELSEIRKNRLLPIKDEARTVDVDGRARRYLIHVPGSPKDVSPMPLVLVLHGGGSDPEVVKRPRITVVNSEWNCPQTDLFPSRSLSKSHPSCRLPLAEYLSAGRYQNEL